MYTMDESYYFTLITIRVSGISCLTLSAFVLLTQIEETKIEDCLFRVPRHQFEQHSEVLRNMLSTPMGCDSVRGGGTDENPIHITGVDKQAFKHFLTILYPPYVLFLRKTF